MTTQMNKKDMMFYFHVFVTVFFMFIFGRIVPPIDPITPIGMQCLGIFIGIVYAWSFTSLLWPSFLGMVALILTGAHTMATWMPISFANSTVVFLIFIFVFTKVIDDAGLVSFLASWIMSRKILKGRPWLFSLFLLLGAFIGGVFVSGFATTLIFWSILYSVCNKFGYKPYSLYPSLMILGIAYCSCSLGSAVLPYRLSAMVLIATMASVAPNFPIDAAMYIIYILPIGLLLTFAYLAIMRWVFKVDLSAMKDISDEFVNKEDLILNKRQKFCGFFLILTTILLISVDLLPKTWALAKTMSSLGTVGVMLIILVLMSLIKVDGSPILNYKTAVQGVQWDMIYLFAFVLPFSSYLTSDATGIKALIIQTITPMLSGMSPVVFTILLLFIGTTLTNVANNAVLAVVFINLAVPILEGMGASPLPFVFLQSFTIALAYMTPAASAPAAFVLGNSDWIKPSMMYKYIPIILILLFIIAIVVGYPYAVFLFGF